VESSFCKRLLQFQFDSGPYFMESNCQDSGLNGLPMSDLLSFNKKKILGLCTTSWIVNQG
jgi:hypothetical protein